MKFKGRKKYTQPEAEKRMENTAQMICVSKECLLYWTTQPRKRSDILIEALCNQSREEMIEQEKQKLEYLNLKMDYLKQFSQDYKLKGSFGYF